MSITEAKPRPSVSLIEGNKMRCPRCELLLDILLFVRLAMAENYTDELTPVYKCPRKRGGCGFVFAPADIADNIAYWKTN